MQSSGFESRHDTLSLIQKKKHKYQQSSQRTAEPSHAASLLWLVSKLISRSFLLVWDEWKVCVFGQMVCNAEWGSDCTGVLSPFSLVRWGVRAAEALEPMLDVSRLPFPPLWSASVCAPAHSADTDVSFPTQRSIFFSLIWIPLNKSLSWLFRPYSPDPLREKNFCLHPQSFKLVLHRHSLSNTSLCCISLSFSSSSHSARLSARLTFSAQRQERDAMLLRFVKWMLELVQE